MYNRFLLASLPKYVVFIHTISAFFIIACLEVIFSRVVFQVLLCKPAMLTVVHLVHPQGMSVSPVEPLYFYRLDIISAVGLNASSSMEAGLIHAIIFHAVLFLEYEIVLFLLSLL